MQLLPEKHLESDLFWNEKRYGKQQYDVLLMGDSRTYMGVSPEILREYIPNMDIYNFGFHRETSFILSAFIIHYIIFKCNI